MKNIISVVFMKNIIKVQKVLEGRLCWIFYNHALHIENLKLLYFNKMCIKYILMIHQRYQHNSATAKHICGEEWVGWLFICIMGKKYTILVECDQYSTQKPSNLDHKNDKTLRGFPAI